MISLSREFDNKASGNRRKRRKYCRKRAARCKGFRCGKCICKRSLYFSRTEDKCIVLITTSKTFTTGKHTTYRAISTVSRERSENSRTISSIVVLSFIQYSSTCVEQFSKTIPIRKTCKACRLGLGEAVATQCFCLYAVSYDTGEFALCSICLNTPISSKFYE